jgi:PAS domain S-box-containing protein
MKPKDRTSKIFDSLSSPVLLIDRDYNIVETNRAARERLEVPGEEAVGQPCFEVTHGLQKPCWHSEEADCPVKKAFETRARSRAIHKHRIGDQIVVEEIVATPLDDGGRGVDYVVEEFRNVTELLNLRENLLPICASCKKVRDEKGEWHHVDTYIHRHTGTDFTHSMCPECLRRQYPKEPAEMI